MTRKSERLNEFLRGELARLIEREIELGGALITVTYVDCSPDLKYARVGVSVLPEKFTGSALKELRKRAGEFSKTLIRQTKLRKIPRFDWRVDDTEVRAAEIEEILKKI